MATRPASDWRVPGELPDRGPAPWFGGFELQLTLSDRQRQTSAAVHKEHIGEGHAPQAR
jgi:hypothetical protein